MKTYNTNYNQRVANANAIKELKKENKNLIVEALKLVDKLINSEEVINKHFKELSKKDKANFILNYKVNNKDTVVKTVLNYKANNLTLQYNLSLSALNDCFKFYTEGSISKSAFKDEEKLVKALKLARKEKELIRYKKVVEKANK